MFDQDADEPFQRAEYGPVDHDRPPGDAVFIDIFDLKILRKLEVQLNGAALPGSSDGILQMKIDLRSVKCAVAFIDTIVQAGIVQRLTQTLGCGLPVLIAAHAVLRSGGKFHMVGKSEFAINLIDQTDDAFDFRRNLFSGHEDMRVILGQAAYPEQAMERTLQFVSVHEAEFAAADRQLPVGMGTAFINQQAAGAVHGLDGIILVVDPCRVHSVTIMGPVAGGFPEGAVQNLRG